MTFQAALDNAEKAVESGSGADAIDVRSCTEAVYMLDTALDIAETAGLREDSPVVTAARDLRQRLQVCIS